MIEGETHSSTRKSNLEEQVEMKHTKITPEMPKQNTSGTFRLAPFKCSMCFNHAEDQMSPFFLTFSLI